MRLFYFLCLASFLRLPAQDTSGYKALNFTAAGVVPVMYTLNPHTKGLMFADFKPSYLFNLQYKGKKNWLWETEFQPYHFHYTGPVVAVTGTYATGPHGTNQVTGTDHVYQKLTFGYYKFQLGVGKQINFKRAYLACTFGVAGIIGSFTNTGIRMQIETIDASSGASIVYGPQSHAEFNTLSLRNTMPRISPYFTLGGGYFLTKKISVCAAFNYCPVLIADLEHGTVEGDSVYPLYVQHLLSFSAGIKFNLTGKYPVQ